MVVVRRYYFQGFHNVQNSSKHTLVFLDCRTSSAFFGVCVYACHVFIFTVQILHIFH